MRSKWIFIVPAALLGMVLFISTGEVVRLLWNWLLPPLFGWRQIRFGKLLDCWRYAASSSADLDSTAALAPILLFAVAWPIEWLIAWLSAGIT